MRFYPIVLFLIISGLVNGQEKAYEKKVQPAVFSLTMVMMHDVINPPAAARFYTYCLLGAYDFIAQYEKNERAAITDFQPLQGIKPGN